MKPFSRRGFLKGLGIGAGAVVGTRLAGGSLIGNAFAATAEPTAVVVVYLNGGFNAIFTGADAFTGTAFGVTAGNSTAIGGGLVIDSVLANAIPAAVRKNVAAVGIRHGISDHGNAQRSNFMSGNASAPLMLAEAIGGTGAIKAAVVGGNALPNGVRPTPIGTTSLQSITDMKATIDAIAGATAAPNTADRGGALKGVTAAQAASKGVIEKHKTSLASVDQGYSSVIATLAKPIQPFNQNQFNTDYTLGGATNINNFKARMAAAELMVRSGANFVIAEDGGWDTHGDTQGTNVRNMMTQRIAPGLTPFITNMIMNGVAERNVTLVIMGDFNRSLPGSDHQANLTALVIGKNIKNGTTAKTNAQVGLPATSPAIPGLWQMLSAASKIDSSPFGANPHLGIVN